MDCRNFERDIAQGLNISHTKARSLIKGLDNALRQSSNPSAAISKAPVKMRRQSSASSDRESDGPPVKLNIQRLPPPPTSALLSNDDDSSNSGEFVQFKFKIVEFAKPPKQPKIEHDSEDEDDPGYWDKAVQPNADFKIVALSPPPSSHDDDGDSDEEIKQPILKKAKAPKTQREQPAPLQTPNPTPVKPHAPEGPAECQMCYEPHEMNMSFECGHWGCQSCVKAMIKRSMGCHVCRAPIHEKDLRRIYFGR
jgi:hypothetical protein